MEGNARREGQGQWETEAIGEAQCKERGKERGERGERREESCDVKRGTRSEQRTEDESLELGARSMQGARGKARRDVAGYCQPPAAAAEPPILGNGCR